MQSANPLARFLAIVLASVMGSIGCWIWASVLLSFGGESMGAGSAWALVRPEVWLFGAECGILLALPAVACLWSRRLAPALAFVLCVGYAAATASILLVNADRGFHLLYAMAATAIATLGALLIVRCVPLPMWTRSSR
ncbi:MAG: hypothetical protein HZA53_04870 [Planctomycetes bacterium]|nr:hypothetical protein [Planctomycetota bacterium]